MIFIRKKVNYTTGQTASTTYSCFTLGISVLNLFMFFTHPTPFHYSLKKKILYSEKGRLPDGDPFSFLYKDLPQHLICSVIHKLFVAWPWKHFGEQNRHNPHYYTLCLRKWKLIEWRINLHF